MIRRDGSIFSFTPLTELAREWIQDNVEYEDWQWFGDSLCVDVRAAGPLFDGIVEAGLSVR